MKNQCLRRKLRRTLAPEGLKSGMTKIAQSRVVATMMSKNATESPELEIRSRRPSQG